MLKAVISVAVVFAVFGIQDGYSDSYGLGKCPNIDPMANFNMQKMLGLWYVIQKTSTSDDCLMYHFAEIKTGKEYELTEIKPHSTIVLSSALHHEHYTTGHLKVTDHDVPADMELDLPFDLGTSRFVVFKTDYDNYAAIFTCKKMAVVKRWSAMILSRHKTPDMSYVDSVRTRLSSYNIDPFTLSIVSQKDCPEVGSKGTVLQGVSNLVQGVKDVVKNVVNNVTSSND